MPDWSWPFVYAVKLGQVGPLLLLLFAIGWRWLDEPIRLGTSGALGTAIKLQPGLILVWAALTRRFRAVVVGLVVLVGAGRARDPAGRRQRLVRLRDAARARSATRSRPTHNFTPGAIAYQLGVPAATASIVQLASHGRGARSGGRLARHWATAEASYLVAVIASQLLSPILWDHYAMLLLLPVAYLLAAGRWWALLIPLVTASPLVGHHAARRLSGRASS